MTGPGAGSEAILSPRAVGQSETIATIRSFFDRTGYILDPHTAVGVSAASHCRTADMPMVCLATAHAAKFGDAVFQAIGRHPELPEAFRGLENKTKPLRNSGPGSRSGPCLCRCPCPGVKPAGNGHDCEALAPMRKASCLFIIAVLLLSCAFFSLAWLAPAYVNSRLIPELKKRYGLQGLTLTVGHLGLERVIFTSLSLTDANDHGIHADSLECSYSFKDLVGKRELEKCVAQGVRVDLLSADSGIFLPGIEPLLAGRNGNSLPNGPEKSPWQLPVTIRSLVLERGHLYFERAGGLLDIPLSLSLSLDRPLSSTAALPFDLHCYPSGLDARVRGRINLGSRGISLQYAGQADLAGLTALLGCLPAGRVEGGIHFTGRFNGGYAPFRINRLEGLEDIAFNGRYGDWRIAATGGTKKREQKTGKSGAAARRRHKIYPAGPAACRARFHGHGGN